MALETDLNTSPFFDDYDEDKQYHRVLFRPSYPVQARELTQLQTILQNQIERFGEHIFEQGTIVKGCNFTYDADYFYAKILDLTLDGLDVDLDSYIDCYAVNESNGIEAIILETVPGLQSDAEGNLNTIYFSYITSGTNNEPTFANGDLITIFSKEYSLQRVDIADGGTLYANSETIIVTGGGGVDAAGYVITHSNGTIKEVVLTTGGSGYVTAPTVTVNTVSGTGAVLTGRHYIDKVTIANSTFLAPVGTGYRFGVSEGVVFQKGFFVKVNPQTIIIDKYTTSPNNVVVGLDIAESVVNNSIDSTLSDNAQGFTNYKAPGAYRLKLEPTLIKMTISESDANTAFFPLAQWQEGRVVKQQDTTKYNRLGAEFARRTKEESGNYAVQQFKIFTQNHATNTQIYRTVVTPGVAYVNGYRVKTDDNFILLSPVASNFATQENATVSLNFGSYVYVNEMMGVFPFNTIGQVSLRSAAGTEITDIAQGSSSDVAVNIPGSQIGTAWLKGIEYDSGTVGTPSCKYRMYLFNIKMSTNKSFANVRSISYSTTGVADVVLDGTSAVLQEPNFATGIYDTKLFALKTFNTGTGYHYRRSATGTFAIGGTTTINLTGSDTFPYGIGALNSVQERDFIIVATSSAQTALRTGTVSTSTSSNVVTGSGTAFLTEYKPGDFVNIDGGDIYYIASIANNTSFNINRNATNNRTGVNHTRYFPSGSIVNIARPTATVTINSTTSASIDLGETLASTFTYTVYHNTLAEDAAVKSSKAVTKNCYVRISNTYLNANQAGPWNLGLPDVHKIIKVYKTTSGATWDEVTDVTTHFTLDTGQQDTFYGLAALKKKSDSSLTINGSTNIIVKLDVFNTSVQAGFFCVDSYPLSNTVPLESDKIAWSDLQSYTSSNGVVYSLRDSLDIRPVVSNTVVRTQTLGSANIITSYTSHATVTFPGTALLPAPNQNIYSDIDYYLPRKDAVFIDEKNSLGIIYGIPGQKPAVPSIPKNTYKIGEVYVPPYPSIPSTSVLRYSLPQYTMTVNARQNRGYTMTDIATLERRIKQVEYYSLLSGLELKLKSLALPSESNTSLERFKNGFFVDPMFDMTISDTSSDEYKVSIDQGKTEATPTFEQSRVIFNTLSGNNSYTNTTRYGAYNVFLTYSHEKFIEQPIATEQQVVAQSFWKFNGKLYIDPAFDSFYDVTNNPVSGSSDEDLRRLLSTKDSGHSYIRVNKSDTEQSVTYDPRVSNTASTTSLSGDQSYNYVELTPNKATTDNVKIGDFITHFSLTPYIRSTVVYFWGFGLKPNTNHYVYFDDTNVSNNVIMLQHKNGATGFTRKKADWVAIANTTIKTRADGIIAGKINIPDKTFLVGQHRIRITNVEEQQLWPTAISSAETIYTAYSFNEGRSDQLVEKVTETIYITEVQQVSTVINNITNIENNTTIIQQPAPTPTTNTASTVIDPIVFNPPAPPPATGGGVVTDTGTIVFSDGGGGGDASSAGCGDAAGASCGPGTGDAAAGDGDGSGGGGGGGGECFTPETLITLADGTAKKIIDIVEGDIVLGINGSHNKVLETLTFTISDNQLHGFNGIEPFVTSSHPIRTHKGWSAFSPEKLKRDWPEDYEMISKENDNLGVFKIDDSSYILYHSTKDNEWYYQQIDNHVAKDMDSNFNVYNLVLDGDHTFIANGIVVHNKKMLCPVVKGENLMVREVGLLTRKYSSALYSNPEIYWGYEVVAEHIIRMVEGKEVAWIFAPCFWMSKEQKLKYSRSHAVWLAHNMVEGFAYGVGRMAGEDIKPTVKGFVVTRILFPIAKVITMFRKKKALKQKGKICQ